MVESQPRSDACHASAILRPAAPSGAAEDGAMTHKVCKVEPKISFADSKLFQEGLKLGSDVRQRRLLPLNVKKKKERKKGV